VNIDENVIFSLPWFPFGSRLPVCLFAFVCVFLAGSNPVNPAAAVYLHPYRNIGKRLANCPTSSFLRTSLHELAVFGMVSSSRLPRLASPTERPLISIARNSIIIAKKWHSAARRLRIFQIDIGS
jgi:hypothetical protein